MAQDRMSNWKKLQVLLVLTGTLVLCASGKSLTVNETLDVCNAEENSNVTLTWIHLVKTTTDRLHLNLRIMELKKSIYLYDSRFSSEPYINDQCRGRLLCDLQLVGEGQLLCVLTDLRLNDTGRYQLCINGECHKKKYQLTVRVPVAPTSSGSPKPPNRERFGFYVSLGLFSVVVVGIMIPLFLLVEIVEYIMKLHLVNTYRQNAPTSPY